MSEIMVWFSYDLGIDGDYESLYYWLDLHKAKECGDNTSVIIYEDNGDIADKIRQDIENSMNLRRKDRIYIIYKDMDGKIRGKFLFGNRKRAPWAGYAETGEEAVEDYL